MTDDHNSIMRRLKAETNDLHSHAESRRLQRDIASGRVDRESFIAYLSQLHHVHGVLESALEESRGEHPAIGAVATADRMRVPDLDRDLEYYGVDRDAVEASDATSRFSARIEETRRSHPVALLGALYVLEGSTNGGRFLAKVLRTSWSLNEKGTAYLDPYGEEQPSRWAAFKRDMDEAAFDTDQEDAMVDMAKTTFLAIAEISDEVAGRGE